MSQPFRLLMAATLAAFVILAIAVRLARPNADLLAPFHPLLFLVVVIFYVVPSALALYRNCTAAVWIETLNIFLGWTLYGWVIALGWAASGKTRIPPSSTAVSSPRSVPGHGRFS